MLKIEKIKFDDWYDDEEYNSTTFYFIAPKEMLAELGYDYPDAVSMEISIEFPLNVLVAEHAYVSISPTNANGEDYDWFDADLPCDEINKLILLAKREINKKKKIKFILTITYNFDGDYLAEAYDTEEDAIIMLNQYLLQEIDTVKTESGYTPSVLTYSDTDKTLVYCEGCTKDSGYNHEEDCAFYRIFEVEV